MAEISSDPSHHSHSRSTPPPSSTSNINPTVQAPAPPPTSFRQFTMPTQNQTPTPNPNPSSNANSNASSKPGDNTKSFMRWSTTSSLPSEPETGKSTWSFHPEEYDPDPVPLVELSNAEFGTSTATDTGNGVGAGDRSSFDTFGRGTPPRSKGRKDGEALNEQEGLPGRVLKFNKDTRSKSKGPVNHAVKNSTSSTLSSSSNDSPPRVHFGNRTPLDTIEGSPSTIRSSPNRHRPAASVSNLDAVLPRPSTQMPRMRTRSKSIDSISLNDSVTALLLPASSRLPLIRQNTLPEEMVARNDLDPEQRAILLRRAKKLEQLLGEALDERSIERLLIDPIHASRTITTRLAETDEAWPDSPTGTTRSGVKEEWTKEDVVPRKGKAVEPPSNGLSRSGSILARTARAALGMAGEKKNDLAVYVSREIRVSETGVRGAKPKPRHCASTPPGRESMSLAAMLRDGPVSPTRNEESDVNEDDSARRTRRLQLAKLHRLLGVPIPPDLVRNSNSTDRSSTPSLPDPEQSFMQMDDNLVTPSPSWTAMLKQTLGLGSARGRRSSSPGRAPTPQGGLIRGESFVDMSTMNEREKAVARRKAHKLEQMFGDTPPQNMFLPLRPATPSDHHVQAQVGEIETSDAPAAGQGRNRTVSHESFAAYQQSLTNLLYLADNDTATLDILMDQLDISEHETRRKRTGKLTHFFGETGIDFDDPPNVATTMERVRSRTNTNTNTHTHTSSASGGGMLDKMMREMWRVVQSEVRRGGMAVKDGERLGEMIDKLRFRRGGGVRLE